MTWEKISKKIGLVLAILFLSGIALFAGLVGWLWYSCSHPKKAAHTEDFYYSLVSGKREDGTKYKHARIHELTETGKTKEVIVIPREIKGYTVTVLFHKASMWDGGTCFYSDVLKKMYIPDAAPHRGTFYNCPNLEKVILYDAGARKLERSSWKKEETQTTRLYISSLEYDKSLYTGNLYKWHHDDYMSFYFANVSYMYNYENAEHNGYYWIDDYDYGTKIDFVPEDPTREGYIFDGWYREPECIRKWDFAIDTLPEEVTEEDEDGETIVTYQETRLYAKWTEK